jgi:hypothetical protein
MLAAGGEGGKKGREKTWEEGPSEGYQIADLLFVGHFCRHISPYKVFGNQAGKGMGAGAPPIDRYPSGPFRSRESAENEVLAEIAADPW